MSRLIATRWKLFWLLVALTLAVYFTMIFWSLPKLSELAGGLIPFDMRPTGYSFEEARAFVSALGETGREFYLERQHLLDSVYPALIGLVLVISLIALDRGGWGWVFAVFAIAGSAFDYMENLAVARMLGTSPDALTVEMVGDASSWTLLKSASHTIAMTGLLVLLLLAGFRYARNRWFNRGAVKDGNLKQSGTGDTGSTANSEDDRTETS